MDVRVGLWRKLSTEELMLSNCGVGEDSWESWKEIQPVHPKGDQSWVFNGRTDAEADTPVLWPHAKSWLIGKDLDAGKDWRWEEKVMTEDEMVGLHHWLDGHEFEQAPGVGDGQGGLVWGSPWGRKESNTTERLDWTEPIWLILGHPALQEHSLHTFQKGNQHWRINTNHTPVTLEHILTFFISHNFSSTHTQMIWLTNSMWSLQKDNSNLCHCNYTNPGAWGWEYYEIPSNGTPPKQGNLIWKPEARLWKETGWGPQEISGLCSHRLPNGHISCPSERSQASSTRDPALQDGSDFLQSRE